MGLLDSVKGARDSVGEIGAGTWKTTAFAKMGAAGVVFTKALIYGGLGVLAFMMFRKVMMYNIDVYIWKRYSNGYRLLKRRGRRYKDKGGKQWFEIVKGMNPFERAKKISWVGYESFQSKEKKGEAIFLLQCGPEDYKPLNMTEKLDDKLRDMDLDILDINAANHSIQLQKEVIDRHRSKNKMLIYLPTIMMVAGMIFVVVLVWITLGRIEQMNSAMTAGYQMMADAVKDFGKQVI
jgi:hypothetical protein